MAKRKQNNTKLYLTLAAVLLSIVGVCLFLFLNSAQFFINDQVFEEQAYTGLQITFGYSGKFSAGPINTSAEILSFSFGNLVPLILVVAGIVLSLIGKNSKIFGFVGGGLLIVAAAFFVFAPQMTMLQADFKSVLDNTLGLLKQTFGFKAAIGAYLGATFTGLAGICSILKVLF